MKAAVAVLIIVLAIVATGVYVGIVHPRQVAQTNCEGQAREFAGYDGLTYETIFDTCMKSSGQLP